MLDTTQCIERNRKRGNIRHEVDRDLEYKLLTEEIEETRQAIDSNDLEEIIDWCIDILYVLCGTMWKSWVHIVAIQWMYEFVREKTDKQDPKTLIDTITQHVTREAIPYFWEYERADLYFRTIDILKSYWLTNDHIQQARQAVCDNNDKKGSKKNKDGKIQKNKNHEKPDFSKIIEEITKKIESSKKAD